SDPGFSFSGGRFSTGKALSSRMAKIRTWHADEALKAILRSQQILPMAGDCDPLFVLCAWDPADCERVDAAKRTLSIHLPVDCRDRISFVRTPLEDVLRGIDEMPREPTTWRAPTQDFHCSFCGRARADVKSLISGPRVFICDACYAASVAQRREIA